MWNRNRLQQIAIQSIRGCRKFWPAQLQFSHHCGRSKVMSLSQCHRTKPLGIIMSRCIKQTAVHLTQESTLDLVMYEEIANTTLDLLAEFLESLSDDGMCPEDFDVYLSSGVLTVNIGGDFGTYVINKQTPNRQIWLSSPKSGPKRYDYVNGRWIYSHTGEDMNELLSKEFSETLQQDIDFSQLDYSIQS